MTFLAGRPDVDGERIGIWGTSYSGGHVLAVAATDRRVKCVVSQAMTISGHDNTIARNSPAAVVDLYRRFAEDRLARQRGEAPALVQAFAEDSDSVRFIQSLPPEYVENWRNEITLRSWELYAEYEPAAFIERIGPTPLLMIIPTGDTMTPSVDALPPTTGRSSPRSWSRWMAITTPFTARPSRRPAGRRGTGSSLTSDRPHGRSPSHESHLVATAVEPKQPCPNCRNRRHQLAIT